MRCIRQAMEDNYKIVAANLKKKIQRVISEYEFISSENEKLNTRIVQYISDLNNSNNKIKELEKKIENLQLMEAFKASTQDVKEAKQKIGRLIKDIDSCIALLND